MLSMTVPEEKNRSLQETKERSLLIAGSDRAGNASSRGEDSVALHPAGYFRNEFYS
jgi:hypothetical protein